MTVTVGETFTINPVSLSGISESNVLSGSASFPDTDGLSVSRISHSVHIVGADKPGWSNSLDGSYSTYSVTALKTGTYVITGSASRCKKYGSSMSGTYVSYYVEERESGSFTCTVTVVDVTSIYIPPTLSLSVGESYKLTPVITDSRANTTLTWQSSNTSVATISPNGTITTSGVGSTIIKCIASNGVSAQCVVTVNPILISGIVVDKSEATMTVGEKLQLEVTVLPENATNKELIWSSTNEIVAIVDNNGQVTAIGIGTCQVKATANDGSGKTAVCLISVKEKTPLAGDVNGDGAVDIGDIVAIINIMAGQSATARNANAE